MGISADLDADELKGLADLKTVRKSPVRAADGPPETYTRGVSSKLGIDATRKHQYPPLAQPPKEHLERVRQDWKKYGFQD